MATIDFSNAPRRFALQDFRSAADAFDGFARSARFAVEFKLRGAVLSNMNSTSIARDLTYLCEVAEMPGRGLKSMDEIRYYGPSFQMPIQTVYDNINLTFLCRNKQYERQFFDNWMEIINPSDTYDFRYKDEYSAQIDIWQFSDIGIDYADAEYSISLLDVYPILINPQSATWTDDSYQRLTVGFSYSRWTRRGLDPEASAFGLVEGTGINVQR